MNKAAAVNEADFGAAAADRANAKAVASEAKAAARKKTDVACDGAKSTKAVTTSIEVHGAASQENQRAAAASEAKAAAAMIKAASARQQQLAKQKPR